MVEPRQFSPYSIVHVVDSLELGGLERVTVDLAKAQRLAGHRVSVFSILSTQGLKQELIDAGIPVFEGHKSGTLDRRVIKALRQLLRQQEADVVHAHNFVPNYYSALAKMGLRHSPVQVCTCHDMGGRLSSRKLRWLFKLSLLATHEVAMVGRQVFDRYMSLGMVPPEHAHVVLNGVPVERFVGGADKRRAAREALNLVEQDLVIGCVGRLVELKNHRRMIEVMPELLQSFRHLKLVILGDGELRSELNELVANLKLSESVILAGARRNVSELQDLKARLVLLEQRALKENLALSELLVRLETVVASARQEWYHKTTVLRWMIIILVLIVLDRLISHFPEIAQIVNKLL